MERLTLAPLHRRQAHVLPELAREEELARKPQGVGHRIPNGTPIENYRHEVKLGREILGLPPVGHERGWARVAF